MVRCVASQDGLLPEWPERQSDIWSGWRISRPSTSVRRTGPDTRYGPFSLGVIVTSAIGGALLSQQTFTDLFKGRRRTRVPVRAAMALARAGAVVGTLTSPTPEGSSPESMRGTSIAG